MNKVFVKLGLLVIALATAIAFSGCLGGGFEAGYAKIKSTYIEYGVEEGSFAPDESAQARAFIEKLNSIKEEFKGQASSQENSALILLVDAKASLAEMQGYALEADEVVEETGGNLGCGKDFEDWRTAFAKAVDYSELAYNKMKLFNETFPQYREPLFEKEGVDLYTASRDLQESMQEILKRADDVCG